MGPLTPLTRTYLQLQVTINCQVACSSEYPAKGHLRAEYSLFKGCLGNTCMPRLMLVRWTDELTFGLSRLFRILKLQLRRVHHVKKAGIKTRYR